MDKLSLAIILGLILGMIDIIPMMIKRLPKYSTISAFIHYFVVTIVIVLIDIPYIPWWLKGGLLGLALMLPMLIHVGHTDKKPLPIITANAIILGSIAGIASHFLLK